MPNTGNQRNPALEGDLAVQKWLEGPDEWNTWIRMNQPRDIRFDGFDFSQYRDQNGTLSFAGYRFGNGNVSFVNAKFGKGNVTFERADFGNGDFHLIEAVFSDGNIDFSRASFGKGDLHFFDTDFGDGDICFDNVTFGTGSVIFTGVRFGKGTTAFLNSNFGNGNVDFRDTKFSGPIVKFANLNFGEGRVDFRRAVFNKCSALFTDCSFKKGTVLFTETDFSQCHLSFRGTTFEDSHLVFYKSSLKNLNFSRTKSINGEITFDGAIFEEGRVEFDSSILSNLFFTPARFNAESFSAHGLLAKGSAVFELPSPLDNLESFEFLGASFDGPLLLSGEFEIVPDFLATKASHQVELSQLKVQLRRTPASPKWYQRILAAAKDPQDAARLRRLKEIAETNKDHQAALRFSADENRARRWIQTSKLGSLLDIAFSALSNYGQCILRPCYWLAAFFVIGAGLYKYLGVKEHPIWEPEWWRAWGHAITLSIGNSLPFLPQSRSLREDAIEALYSNHPSLLIDAIMIGQGALSFIFLFLIGLGLRNRFRL